MWVFKERAVVNRRDAKVLYDEAHDPGHEEASIYEHSVGGHVLKVFDDGYFYMARSVDDGEDFEDDNGNCGAWLADWPKS